MRVVLPSPDSPVASQLSHCSHMQFLSAHTDDHDSEVSPTFRDDFVFLEREKKRKGLFSEWWGDLYEEIRTWFGKFAMPMPSKEGAGADIGRCVIWATTTVRRRNYSSTRSNELVLTSVCIVARLSILPRSTLYPDLYFPCKHSFFLEGRSFPRRP
jgi:hypothetical protein